MSQNAKEWVFSVTLENSYIEIGTYRDSLLAMPQLLENSQLTLMEEWRCWCATFTIRAITAHPTSPFMEQHTRANLVFSSDFVLHTHHIFQFFPLKLVYFWTKIRKNTYGCFFHSFCATDLNFGIKNNGRMKWSTSKTLIFASYLGSALQISKKHLANFFFTWSLCHLWDT